MMPHAVIVDAIRTPTGRGKAGGALSAVHPVDLLATVLAQLVARNGLDPALVDDVIGGCVTQAGQQSLNVTRNAVLAAGFPVTVPATTIDRQCGSSQQAAHFAAQAVMAGVCEIVIACGVESMSRAPMFSNAMGQDAFGPTMAKRFPDGLVPQGISAEMIANQWSLSRKMLDEYAMRSHRLAAEVVTRGGFDSEMVYVETLGADGQPLLVRDDETIRPSTSADSLAALKPAFAGAPGADRFPNIDWRVTAGNSSSLADGASAVLIMSDKRAEQLGFVPRARFHSFAVTGDDPLLMLMGVVPATRMVLEKGKLALGDIDHFEVNEAFASVPLAWQHEIGADAALVNPRGGAIALGHPLGASGARLLTSLLRGLEETGGRYGLQTMCEGGGMANATVIERLH